MAREKIGEAQTDKNGKAKINLPITDTKSFTIEAKYHELSKSKKITSIAPNLSLNIPSSVEAGVIFTVNGLFLLNDKPAPSGIQINIIIIDPTGIASRVTCKTNSEGEFSATKLHLDFLSIGMSTYVFHAEVNNYPSIKSENYYIDVTSPSGNL